MLFAITVGVTIDIILRNFFKSGLLGMTEYTGQWLVMVFLGALCLNTGDCRQVIVDFITEKAPPVIKEIINLFGRLIALFLFIATSGYCIDQAVNAIAKKSTLSGIAHVMVWPYKLFMAIVFVSMIIRLILDIIFSINSIRHKEVYKFKEEPSHKGQEAKEK